MGCICFQVQVWYEFGEFVDYGQIGVFDVSFDVVMYGIGVVGIVLFEVVGGEVIQFDCEVFVDLIINQGVQGIGFVGFRGFYVVGWGSDVVDGGDVIFQVDVYVVVNGLCCY